MSKQDFDAFINQATKRQDDSVIDWNKTRNDWITYLEQFYETIKGFLSDYEKARKLSYDFSKKEIFEEYIGSYSVNVMDIKLGEHRVKLEPMGTNLIGAHGRVDLIGVNGKVKFVLVNKIHSAPPNIKVTIHVEGESKPEEQQTIQTEKLELVWKIATPPPRIKYIDLNQDVFFDAMLEVIGG
jgi:hypothetical protein